MKTFLTRKRRYWAMGIATAVAAVLWGGGAYLDSWRSPQYSYYNYALQMYASGDHVCSKEEAADPQKNQCIDIDLTMKVFGASMQSYARQHQDPSPVEQFLLPDPSRELAALAAMHQGILSIMKQKPEDAVKALKLSIQLGDTTEEDKFVAQGGVLPPAKAREVARLKQVKLTAQYNLELLFKNPSQANAQGKGDPKNGKQPGKPDQGKSMDGDPSDGASKGRKNAI